MHAPYRVGLTGGIASGKSAVADAFARRGIPIVDTDAIARDVVEPGRPALAEVVRTFGPGVLDADGRLDRRALRTLVFAQPELRRRLEAILHPAIRTEMHARADAAAGPYVVVAIPLLVENGLQAQVDRVLVVDCPPELQLARLLARDGETPEGARRILAAQASREARLAAADDVLLNDGSLAALDARVDALHRTYLVRAGGAAAPGR